MPEAGAHNECSTGFQTHVRDQSEVRRSKMNSYLCFL